MTNPLTFLRHNLFLAPVALLAAALTLVGAEATRFQAQPGSKVRIEGTSTIHDWTVEGQIIGGIMEFTEQFPEKAAAAIKVKPKVSVNIPVRSLKSGKTPMDEVMHTAMKQTQHPNITYQLLEIKLKEAPADAKGKLTFDTKGALTVAGVTRTNSMVVTMEPQPSDKLKVSGATNVKMTDFGIKPPAPSLALGLIKTGDDVKINFEWVTVKKK
jgi:polyisoprenoid-binding protein YceI